MNSYPFMEIYHNSEIQQQQQPQQPRRKWTKKRKRKIVENGESNGETEQRWITYEPTCRTKTEKITPFVRTLYAIKYEHADFSNHEMKMNLIWSDMCDKRNHFNRTNHYYLFLFFCAVRLTKQKLKCSMIFRSIFSVFLEWINFF